MAVVSMFLLLVLTLGSALAATPPPKPSPKSTFQASGEAEQHLPEQTIFGSCESQLASSLANLKPEPLELNLVAVEFGVDFEHNMAYQHEIYENGPAKESRMIVQSQNVTSYVRK